MATELASAYLTLIPSLSGAQKKIEAQLSGVDTSKPSKKMGASLVSGIGGGLKTVAKIGVGAIASVGVAVAGLAASGGISRALKLDQAQFKFKALGMDVQATMESCNQAVSGTAFGLDAAATVATQLGAAGVASGDAMTGALKSVAGVAAMSSSSMEDVGAIFAKVAAKGKAGGDELLQLTERGINATAALAKYLGKSSEEVTKMVSKGQIDFATFSAAMQATFGEAASGANATFQGAMSNVMAALSRVGAKFASPALEGLRKVFVALIPAIDAVSAALDPAVEIFSKFAQAVSGRVVAGINVFTDTLKEAGSFAVAFTSGLKAAFSETALSGLFSAVNDSAGAFFEIIKSGGSKVDALKSAVSALCSGMKSWIAQAFDGTAVRVFVNWIQGCLILFRMGATPIEGFRLVLENLKTTVSRISSSKVFAEAFDGTAVMAFANWIQGCIILFRMGQTPIEGFRLVLENLKNTVLRIASSTGLSEFIDGIKEKFSQLPQPVKDAADFIGNAVSRIKDLIGGISPSAAIAVAAFAGIMAKFSGNIKTVVSVAAGIGPKIGGVLSGVASGLGSAFGVLFNVFNGGLPTALKFVSGAIAGLVSPVGLAVVAIAALGAAFIAMMATNSQFRETVIEIVQQIGSSLAPILTTVGQALSSLASTVLPLIGSMIRMLVPVLAQIVMVVLQVIAAVAPLVTTLVAILVPIITQIIQLIVTVATQILAAVLPVISLILTAIQTAMPAIQAIVMIVMTQVLSIVQAVWPVIEAIISGVMAVVQGVIETVWPIIETIITTVMAAIQDVINIVTAAISGDWEGVWNSIKDLFSDVWEGIKTGAQQGVDAVLNIVSGIKDSILGVFSDAGSWLLDAGSNILHGLWEGISGALDWLGGQLGGIGSFIAEHKGPKQYDLKLLVPNGVWIMESLASGFEKGEGGIAKTLSGVADMVAGWKFDTASVAVPFDRAALAPMRRASYTEVPSSTNYNYTFGDITIDASSLKDIETAADFANALVKEGRSR